MKPIAISSLILAAIAVMVAWMQGEYISKLETTKPHVSFYDTAGCYRGNCPIDSAVIQGNTTILYYQGRRGNEVPSIK